MTRYAAIDIGSNAVRLLLCNAIEEHGETKFKLAEHVRIPLRLGEDVFQNGNVSEEKCRKFIKTMSAFKLLIDVFDPVAYRACATASLREAMNGLQLVRRVKRECGLRIEIISGKTEAELIYANHIEQSVKTKSAFLYIDVGGGSTELTLFDDGQIIASRSFNVGTLRWLQKKVSTFQWEMMKAWVKKITEGHSPLIAIGSGGNINKISKLISRKEKPLRFSALRELYDSLKLHTVEERMEIWKLNQDRADVIVPAAKIFLSLMKAAEINEILVPQIGLSDGIIHQLHDDFQRNSLIKHTA